MDTLDKRHSIALEYCGHRVPMWVHRFCGEWVACHGTKAEAMVAALKWENGRL